MSRVSVAFRLPAFASRPSDSRRGTGPSSRSAYRPNGTGPRRGLPRFACTSYDRGGCLLCPEDGGALPDWTRSPAGACRFPAASPCAPLRHPIGGADRNETSARGSCASPVRSASRLSPPDGTDALGLLPDASNPAGNASDARQAEARPLSTSLELRLRQSSNLQSTSLTHMHATSRRTRRSVLTRSLAPRGILPGAATRQSISAAAKPRARP